MRAITSLLPDEDIIYFGDTARVPYGFKSGQTIIQFAREDCRFLMRIKPKMIVLACNTASAVALDALRSELTLPISDVIEPGARAAIASGAKRIGVIGTETTIGSGAYERRISLMDSRCEVYSRACPLFVSAVEEGRQSRDPIVKALAQEYLAYFRDKGLGAMVLGCTHYPLIREAIQEELGPWVSLVDSASEAALTVREVLKNQNLFRPAGQGARTLRFYSSDNPERFARVGSRFMGMEIVRVDLVSPEEFFQASGGE